MGKILHFSAKKRGKVRLPEDDWLLWNYSKLDTLLRCPYQFFLRYVLRKPYPHSSIAVVGAALHYMAYRFFDPRVRYKTPESFARAWKGFWLGVIKGEHGPEGFDDDPIEKIAWLFDEEPWMWLNKGADVMRGFFKRNADFRGTGVGVLRERYFEVMWHGFRLNGKIDRLDIVAGGVRIRDYKMGRLADYMLQDTPQATCYQIGYAEALQGLPKMNGRPLVEMDIENLMTGKVFSMPLRTEIEFARLHRLLAEASAYVKGVLTGEQPDAQQFGGFQVFNPDHIAEQTFRPRLPRGSHCEYCNFIPECRTWENATTRPTSASLWAARLTELRRAALPAQIELLNIERQKPLRRSRKA